MGGFTVRAALVAAALLTFVLACNGQALATHVGCGDTITQDTTLDSDLIGCSGPFGIQIGADNIRLDFNGHRLEGEAGTITPLELGVVNDGHRGVTIENGKVGGSAIGIGFMNADRNRLRAMEVTTSDCPSALLLAGSHDNRIKDSAFFGDCNAVRLTDSSRNHFVENRTATLRCAEAGVCGEFHSGGGVYVEGGGENTFVRNTFTQGVFALYSTLNNVVRENYVALANGDGISSRFGFGRGANRIVRNEVVGNTNAGIFSENGDEIRRNFVRENLHQGIRVPDGAAELVGNRVEHNQRTGILVAGTGALIRRNLAIGNRFYGIAADPESIDGGGNKAFGNGTPQQCLNVVCK